MSIDESPDFASRKLQLELTRVRQAQEAARLASLAAEIELLLLEQREPREGTPDLPAEVPKHRFPAGSDPVAAQEVADRFPPSVSRSDPRRLDPTELTPSSGWLGEAFEPPTVNRLRAADALVEAIRRLVRSPQSTQDGGQLSDEGLPAWRAEGPTRRVPDGGHRTRFEPGEPPAGPQEGWGQRLQTLRSSHREGHQGGRDHPSAATPASPGPQPPAATARYPGDKIGSVSDGQTGVKFDAAAPAGRLSDEGGSVRPADRTDPPPTELPAASVALTSELGRPAVTAARGDESGASGGESQPTEATTSPALSDESMPSLSSQPQSPPPKSQQDESQPGKSQPDKSRSTGPELRKTERTESVSVDVVAKRFVAAADTEPATRRSRPAAWLVSLLSHVALLLALGFLSLSVPQSRDQLALSASATEASEDPVETFTIESPAEVAIDQPEEVSAPAWESESSPLGEGLASDVALDLAVGPPTPATDGMPNPAATDLASSQLTANSDNRVQFAGIDGGGNHFVYLVDSSNSMKNFNEARQELLRSVESLREDQRFYVIFYDQQPDYMRLTNTGRDEPTSLRATAANKLAVRRWAMTITQERGKSPVEALEFAFDLRPDVIFLLSDGEFTMRTEEVIRERNHRDNLFGDAQRLSIVHTIRYPGFSSSEAKKAESQMRRIAEENGGQYRNIEIR
ncbi:MAG: hypothetical protein EA381_10890 [Planctomycetaceae bacterium]|nr:MAG: hypothetical protein EA381_10890 [Planctomycetaceae bacterium]